MVTKKTYYRHVMPFIYQKILSGFSYSQKRRYPMHVGRKAQKREKKAMSVSLYGNLFFVIVEIVMAIYWTQSMTESSSACSCRRFF